jgi:hypothetical protein
LFVLAVDEEQVVGRRLPVGAELTAFKRSDLQRGHQAGNRLHQAELAAPGARRVVDFVAGDVGADVARRRLDHRTLGGDRHLFAHARQAHRQRHSNFLTDAQDEAGSRQRFESLQLRFQRIAAGHERGNDEAAFAARHGLAALARSFVRDRHGHPGKDELGLVGDRSVELGAAAAALGKRCRTDENGKNESVEGKTPAHGDLLLRTATNNSASW